MSIGEWTPSKRHLAPSHEHFRRACLSALTVWVMCDGNSALTALAVTLSRLTGVNEVLFHICWRDKWEHLQLRRTTMMSMWWRLEVGGDRGVLAGSTERAPVSRVASLSNHQGPNLCPAPPQRQRHFRRCKRFAPLGICTILCPRRFQILDEMFYLHWQRRKACWVSGFFFSIIQAQPDRLPLQHPTLPSGAAVEG